LRWRFQEPKIGDLDGFQNTDLFGYAGFGDWLANIVGGAEDEPVVLIDGDWGSGKTVFARQWAGVLRERGHAVLYFDAFAADCQDDPFLALVEAVYAFAEKQGVEGELRAKFSTEAAKAAGAALGLGLGRLALDRVGLVETVDEVREAMRSDRTRLKGWIESATERKRTVATFRETLERLAQAVVSATGAESRANAAAAEEPGDRGRLVFLVDELDRCRPDFALGVLERIKHVFGVPGVCFVLVTNVADLEQSVRRAYGEVRARTYLEKFFDLRFRLPDRALHGGTPKAGVYARHLLRTLAMPRIAYGYQPVGAFGSLAARRQMSLRTMEHAARNILVLASGPGVRFFSADVPSGVVVSAMRVVDPALFKRLRRGEVDEADAAVLKFKVDAVMGPPRPPQPGRFGTEREVDEGLHEMRERCGSHSWELRQAARCLNTFDL